MSEDLKTEFEALVLEVGEPQALALLKAVRSGNAAFAHDAARIVADELASLRAVKAANP